MYLYILVNKYIYTYFGNVSVGKKLVNSGGGDHVWKHWSWNKFWKKKGSRVAEK